MKVGTLFSIIVTLVLGKRLVRQKRHIQSSSKDNYSAFQTFSSLLKDGLRKEDIFYVVDIINKDFPGISISELVEDVRTYGSLRAAAGKLEREYDAENEVML